jgi:hypothetical protein
MSEKSELERLKELRAETLKACSQEVEAVLAKYECQLVGVPGMVPDGNGGWRIVTRVDLAYRS